MEAFIYAALGALAMLGAGGIYMLAKKGLPALKNWLSKGKSDLTSLRADVADAHMAATSASSLASTAKSDLVNLATRVTAAEMAIANGLPADIAAIKARLDKAGIAV